MTSTLTLKNKHLRCVLRPDLGGSIESLVWQGLNDLVQSDVPIFREPPHQIRTAHDMGSFVLVPFSNRMAKACLQWNGAAHWLSKMGTQEEHAIHGVAWQRPWQVLEAREDFAMLSYQHTADAAWPFAFDVRHSLTLEGGALSMSLSITNLAPSAAPVGLGWHPYFSKRSTSRLSFRAASRWDMGVDKLPTQSTASPGIEGAIANLDVDHCFEGWAGEARLEDAALSIRITSDLSRLVVYTTPAKNFIAIEPVSHVSNAVNSAASLDALRLLGVQVLASGETYSCQMQIEVKCKLK